jgi:hypothetical protein
LCFYISITIKKLEIFILFEERKMFLKNFWDLYKVYKKLIFSLWIYYFLFILLNFIKNLINKIFIFLQKYLIRGDFIVKKIKIF